MGWWPRPGLALLLCLLAGAGGLALLAYCAHFDRRRLSAPDYKRRLREKRRKEREQEKQRKKELREQKDLAKLQDFFLQEIQLGEWWLERGEHKKAIEHLCNAITLSTHPAQVMKILEQTLPPQVFEMLQQRIPYLVEELETALNVQDPLDE